VTGFVGLATNAVFAAPANLALTAKAVTQGGVTDVKFYVNGALAEARSMYSRLYAPFNRQLTGASNYALGVSAHDNRGFSKTSVVDIVVEPAPTQSNVLVAAGSAWKYLDDGSDPGPAWRALGFNDAGWSNGPAALGYGRPALATTVRSNRASGAPITTTWFRHAWLVPDPAQFRKVAARVMGDDGARLFLNGAEIFRHNLPSDPIGAATLSLETTDPSGFLSGAYADASLLVVGTNVLAAEVHQASSGTADLLFDLELIALANPPPPTLAIQCVPASTVLLSWPYSADGFRLMSTPWLAPADWRDVTNAPARVGNDLQVTLPAPVDGGFYQLLKGN
jgi:hypothetical protein